jgi:hypothetical protein
MKKLTKPILFAVGFFGSISIFVIANLFPFSMTQSNRLANPLNSYFGGKAYGFPFTFYVQWDGFPAETSLAWTAAAINLIIAVSCGLLVGFALRTVGGRRATLN